MATRLKYLIKWAPKEIVQDNMPQIFKETYPITRFSLSDLLPMKLGVRHIQTIRSITPPSS